MTIISSHGVISTGVKKLRGTSDERMQPVPACSSDDAKHAPGLTIIIFIRRVHVMKWELLKKLRGYTKRVMSKD